MSNVVDLMAVRAKRASDFDYIVEIEPDDERALADLFERREEAALDANEVVLAATEALIALTAENARLRALLDDRRTVRWFASGFWLALGGILASVLS